MGDVFDVGPVEEVGIGADLEVRFLLSDRLHHMLDRLALTRAEALVRRTPRGEIIIRTQRYRQVSRHKFSDHSFHWLEEQVSPLVPWYRYRYRTVLRGREVVRPHQ